LRTTWAERAGEIAAELASHFERGGDLGSAIEYYDKAAAAAASQGANREAVGYLDRALALLERSDDSQARRERQLEVLMTRGPSVLAASGYGSVEALDNYERALDLALQLDNPIGQISSLMPLSICQQTRGNLAAGEQLALELVRVAERLNLPAPFIAQLSNPLSQVRLYQGAVDDALALSDAAVAVMEILRPPLTPRDSRPALWAEPSVLLYCQHGAASFAAGRLTQAGAAVEHALCIARELRHPFTLAYASCWAALYEDTIGQWESAIRLARQAIDTAQTYDFPFWDGVARIFCGHAMACSGDPGAGLPLLREGIERWRRTGGRLAATMYFNMLAEACLVAGDVAAAQAALGEAAVHAEQTGEQVFVAEIYRLQAECHRRTGAAPAEVETLHHRAMETARRQSTRLWELRSTLAWHRLRHSAESRAALAAACSAFEQEAATGNVAAARAMLAAWPLSAERTPLPKN